MPKSKRVNNKKKNKSNETQEVPTDSSPALDGSGTVDAPMLTSSGVVEGEIAPNLVQEEVTPALELPEAVTTSEEDNGETNLDLRTRRSPQIDSVGKVGSREILQIWNGEKELDMDLGEDDSGRMAPRNWVRGNELSR